ncbi:hypothetical protein K8354_01720 [Polaribacter litorisediminis]|uniref:hypothetical protein n=1 Tax=Polaribacter litorisediminis TaxID=1908341 RepID=UPI001CC0E5C8|nr:hypothetical protein [Polaribacter litorisediminis]UAM98573.1 hypothetical protein K8354_01720 [Polaribacter litorisediminis]
MTVLTITYLVITLFSITLLGLWFSLLNRMGNDELEEKQYLRLEENLIDGIASSYSEDSNELAIKKLQYASRYMKYNKSKFSSVAYVFLKVNCVFKFSKSTNLKTLFHHLGLNTDLRKKLQSKDWFDKAKAIWLSYELNLSENNLIISNYKDGENRLVKREAQIALITFMGWKSLNSFPDITIPISLWQQIRIIEKLQEIEAPFDVIAFEKALKADNHITRELMVRIIKNFKLHHYIDYVNEQLNSDNKQLAKVALEALDQLDPNHLGLKQIEQRLPEAPELMQRAVSSNYQHVSK